MVTNRHVMVAMRRHNRISRKSTLLQLLWWITGISASYKLMRYFTGEFYNKHICWYDPICVYSSHFADSNPKIRVLRSYMLDTGQTKHMQFMMDTITLDTFLLFFSFCALLYFYVTSQTISFWAYKQMRKSSDWSLDNMPKDLSWFGIAVPIFIFWMAWVFFHEVRPDMVERKREWTSLTQIYQQPLVSLSDTFHLMTIVSVSAGYIWLISAFDYVKAAILDYENEKASTKE